MTSEIRNETIHSMKRRSNHHNYCLPGIYHITINTARTLHQPLGRMAGRYDQTDDTAADAPHVELTAIGQMVRQELTTSISRYYPMLEVQDHVIMPEHLHFILVAHSDILTKGGRSTHLGQVLAGFKQGCNRRYWAMTGQTDPTARPATGSTPEQYRAAALAAASTAAGAATPAATPAAAKPLRTGAAPSVLGGLAAQPAPAQTPTAQTAAAQTAPALPPLFEPGYCDVMPIDQEQLATQRAYIKDNPRSRLLRMTHRDRLQVNRRLTDTAVTPSALRGYLQRECRYQYSDEAFATITQRLLYKEKATPAYTKATPAYTKATGTPPFSLKEREHTHIMCDGYGNAELLKLPLLPVVCHRRDAALFERQMEACMKAAAAGGVLVSARIAKGEQAILDAALQAGYPVVRIEDNGFPEIYHPSKDRINECATGKLLILTPWSYHFRGHDDSINVIFCKTMNCLAQAICKRKDDWWKK